MEKISIFSKDGIFNIKTSDNWNFKYYRYDERKRVIKMWNIIADFDTLITEYKYNSQDQIILYSHSGMGETKTYRNTYDYTGRLSKVDYYIGSPDAIDPDYINLAEYDYNENSQVSNQKYQDGSITNEYFYNNRNWITSTNNSNKTFEYENNYFKNGNVKSMELTGEYKNNFTNTSDLAFTYQYDKSNRLTASVTSDKSFELVNTYDKDGNILTLNRLGSTGNTVDNFSYSYYSGTNKVSKVKGSTNQYLYDANGNMIIDSLNRNTIIKYDYRNLITQIQHKAIVNNDTSFYLTYYSYDEAGNRFAKTVFKYSSSSGPSTDTSNGGATTDDDWELNSVEIYSRDISGKELAIYKDGAILEYPVYGLDMIGKIKSDELFFYYKDHLGSVRATVNSSGDVVSAQDFDSWGYLLQDRVFDSDDSKFKFTGKERDVESDYDYFGARYYDSRIGRWGSPDVLESKALGWTPYRAFFDNPLKYTDPNGKLEFPNAANYPRLAQYLRNGIQEITGNHVIMEALTYYGEFTEQQIKDALVWDEGPTVELKKMNRDVLGQYDYINNPEVLSLNEELVNSLEHAVGADRDIKLFLVAVTLLHELTHYGENRGIKVFEEYIDGSFKKVEVGDKFEQTAYGDQISSKNAEYYLSVYQENQKMQRRYGKGTK